MCKSRPPSSPYVTPSRTDRINKLYAAPLDMCVSLLSDLHTPGTYATRGGRKKFNWNNVDYSSTAPRRDREEIIHLYYTHNQRIWYAEKIIS